jgi:hypothetical protein
VDTEVQKVLDELTLNITSAAPIAPTKVIGLIDWSIVTDYSTFRSSSVSLFIKKTVCGRPVWFVNRSIGRLSFQSLAGSHWLSIRLHTHSHARTLPLPSLSLSCNNNKTPPTPTQQVAGPAVATATAEDEEAAKAEQEREELELKHMKDRLNAL